MSANAAEASKDVPKASGSNSKEQEPFDGAEKILEWRGNISRLYPEIHRRAALDDGHDKKVLYLPRRVACIHSQAASIDRKIARKRARKQV